MMPLFRVAPLWLLLCLLCLSAMAAPASAGQRPYAADSPWNLKIGPKPEYDRFSEMMVAELSGVFGVDPTRYTMPVYEVDAATPLQPLRIKGFYSNVDSASGMLAVEKKTMVRVPMPDNAAPAAGSDAQIILWNPETGDEWGFWRVERRAGRWEAQNGYHYDTRLDAVPPLGFISRGAGVPYLVGLIRPFEIKQGRIEHAIAFGVDYPSPLFVYPATKSDGEAPPPAMPSGTRLQLDPTLGEEDFDAWGLDTTGKIIARALQEYGMILIDSSGHPKIYAEYDGTAHWGDLLHKDTVRAIPYRHFKVLSLGAKQRPAAPKDLQAQADGDGIALTWSPSPGATRYRVLRRCPGSQADMLHDWVTAPNFSDAAPPAAGCSYDVHAVSHNGVSRAATVQAP